MNRPPRSGRVAPDVPLIPRQKLFGNPSQVAGRLSPDGKYLAWIAPRDGVLNIYVAPTSAPQAAYPVTNERQRPIQHYFWSPDSGQILFINDQGGDENFLLYSVDIASGKQRKLTPFEKIRVIIAGISREVKNRILIGANNRDPRWHDIHSLDLTTGALTPVLMNTGGYAPGFRADEQLNVRIASRSRPDGGSEFYRVVNDQVEAEPFEAVALEDSQTTRPLHFTSNGQTLYWLDSRGRDTAVLIAQDLATGGKSVVAENAQADIRGTMAGPTTGVVEAYAVNYFKNEWVPIGDAIKGDLDFLKRKLPGQITVTSRTDADDQWLVTVDPVTTPMSTQLYDRRAQTLTPLFVSRPELEGAPLAAMHPLEIKTRDGLTMVSYLTLPPDCDAAGQGKPDWPVPMVLLVHGGPWWRDEYGYDEYPQWLANRGYAVLAVNFRGSTGFGKKFISAGDLQWGGKMHDDLLDAVDWAVAAGITTSDKVAIMGGSYGGYATLVGLAFTPEKFVCGIDIVGPSNLATFLATIPPYWEAIRAQFHQRMGDPTTPQGQTLLRERSPLFAADQIRRPLLIVQGANDPRVQANESQQIVEALRTKNIPVTYVVFPDEGHGFAHPQNSIAFAAVAENFLAKYLRGKAEPVGDALKASTAQVSCGAEFAAGF